MPYDFDTLVPRRLTNCAKWEWFEDDVLPMWVADMDFRSPEPVIDALHSRVEHGFFGYGMPDPEDISEVLLERLATRHHLHVEKEALIYLPGLVVGLNVMSRAIGEPGDDILTLTPIYPPFLSAIEWSGRNRIDAPLRRVEEGSVVRYEIDFDALVAAITPRTRLLLLCNPHNPIGRIYSRAELERIGDIAIRHDLVICCDEIHCDLLLEGEHVSIASLAPEIADRTITLLAPSKTFNLPGLGFSFAVATNPDLRAKINAVTNGIMAHPNILGFVAAKAAYLRGQEWLDELLVYLKGNRDTLVEFVTEHLPGVKITQPNGTYLAWLDFNALQLPEKPSDFFLHTAKVALNDGAAFGKEGEGYARLNFGCPRAMLVDALERMQRALEEVRQP